VFACKYNQSINPSITMNIYTAAERREKRSIFAAPVARLFWCVAVHNLLSVRLFVCFVSEVFFFFFSRSSIVSRSSRTACWRALFVSFAFASFVVGAALGNLPLPRLDLVNERMNDSIKFTNPLRQVHTRFRTDSRLC
jgi:hypothetical protein